MPNDPFSGRGAGEELGSSNAAHPTTVVPKVPLNPDAPDQAATRRRLVPGDDATVAELERPAVPGADAKRRGGGGSKPSRAARGRGAGRPGPAAVRRARKVRRIVRHIEPWSTLKLSLLFYSCMFIVVLVAGFVLWQAGSAFGVVENVEDLIEEMFALEEFTFRGLVIFQASILIGLIAVVALSALNVLLVVIFNLISDLVGGVRITVLEEEHLAAGTPAGTPPGAAGGRGGPAEAAPALRR